MASWWSEATMTNKQRIEKAAALAARVAGDLNLAIVRGKMSGAIVQSSVAGLAEAQQLLKELDPKEGKK